MFNLTRTLRTLLVAAALLPVVLAPWTPAVAGDHRAASSRRGWWPTGTFGQFGSAEDAQMAVIGLTWDWPWQRPFLGGRLGGYWEVSFGRWDADSPPRGAGWFTHFGVTPVLRWDFGRRERWFAELGIGANLLAPIYQNDDKRFSTTFNFGDHLAVGRRFGEDVQHALSLRIQHFSNGSIRKPNPGENFLQLRYSQQF
jgi:hypothetical protein